MSSQKNYDLKMMENEETNKIISSELKNKTSPSGNCCNVLETMSASISSSLASPSDSGVQLLDSESDLASIMSMSGYDFTFNENTDNKIETKNCPDDVSLSNSMSDHRISVILNQHFQIADTKSTVSELKNETNSQEILKDVKEISNNLVIPTSSLMTNSDIVNQNTTPPLYDYKMYSKSAPEIDTKLKEETKNDVDFLLNDKCHKSKTLNDLQIQNKSLIQKESAVSESCQSLSVEPKEFSKQELRPAKEINISKVEANCMKDNSVENVFIDEESLKNALNSEETNSESKLFSNDSESNQSNTPIIDKDDVMQQSIITPMVDEQIVYRRQRRKKLKDTPKKRVSFHEDILNSTKIDDIHIDRGFVTRQHDPFLIQKRGIVIGRYSWAAEGDSQYYQNNMNERQVQSDIICRSNIYNSTSSSSSMSLDSTNSSDCSGDSPGEEYSSSPSVINGIQNIKKMPKTSCLKKTKHGRNYIDTKIVQEENSNTSRRNLTRKISESNILDTNIFGSLKNIYKTFSSSVPLAERGVPEGQEDFTTHSSAENLFRSKRDSFCSNETLFSRSYDGTPVNVPVVCEPEEVIQPVQIYKKPNLRLSRSEGFYPNYPQQVENQPENIILCDSNVYEHRGISYSYEYDQFTQQNSFNREQNKTKSYTLYQMLLQELNFLKKSEKRNKSPQKKSANDAEVKIKKIDENKSLQSSVITSSPTKKQEQRKPSNDWGSDNESASDTSERPHSRHLQSPLKKRNVKLNHYSIQNSWKSFDADENLSDISSVSHSEKMNLITLKSANSKTSLINRFLRNTAQRKMLESKLNGLTKTNKNNFLGFYLKNVKPNKKMVDDLNEEIENEILSHQLTQQQHPNLSQYQQLQVKIKTTIFQDDKEILLDIFKIRSAYNKKGESKPMLILLTNSVLYVSTVNRHQNYYNEFLIPYKDLHFILIGPNRQTIYFSNKTKTLQYFVTTADFDLTTNIISRIEHAMRSTHNNHLELAAIKELSLHDLTKLRLEVYKQTPVTKDEDFYHYSLVNIQEDQLSPSSNPLGPFREGFLMYRKAKTDERWKFGYFILKGGILYMLSSPTCRIPIKVIPLQNGACQGAHRTQPKPRPHTFELLTITESLEFAASDEYEASDWLQALVQSASGMQIADDTPRTSCCSLILTTDHLVTMRECFNVEMLPNDSDSEVLSYAAISDLIAFKVPLVDHSWCVLEFSCREVHESSGDWILFFASNKELDKFLSILEILWSYTNSQGDSFPLTTVPETEILNRQANETYRVLQQTWMVFQ